MDEPAVIAELDVFAPVRAFTARHAAILLPFDTVLGALEAAMESVGLGGD